jgi:ribosomal protein L7Ae-like RNA K-turn-binding protein
VYTKIKNLIDANPLRVVGLKQVLKGIEDGTVWCVIVSSDSDEFIRSHIEESIGTKNVRIECIDSKEKLGALAGIDVPAAAVGLMVKSQKTI